MERGSKGGREGERVMLFFPSIFHLTVHGRIVDHQNGGLPRIHGFKQGLYCNDLSRDERTMSFVCLCLFLVGLFIGSRGYVLSARDQRHIRDGTCRRSQIMVRVQWELDKEGTSFAFPLTLSPDLAVLMQVHNAW